MAPPNWNGVNSDLTSLPGRNSDLWGRWNAALAKDNFRYKLRDERQMSILNLLSVQTHKFERIIKSVGFLVQAPWIYTKFTEDVLVWTRVVDQAMPHGLLHVLEFAVLNVEYVCTMKLATTDPFSWEKVSCVGLFVLPSTTPSCSQRKQF